MSAGAMGYPGGLEPRTVPEGCPPGAYVLIREYFLANYCDGDDAGMMTVKVSQLADDLAELFSSDDWRRTWNEGLYAEMRAGGGRRGATPVAEGCQSRLRGRWGVHAKCGLPAGHDGSEHTNGWRTWTETAP